MCGSASAQQFVERLPVLGDGLLRRRLAATHRSTRVRGGMVDVDELAR